MSGNDKHELTASVWSDPAVVDVLAQLQAPERMKVISFVEKFIDSWYDGVVRPLTAMSGSNT